MHSALDILAYGLLETHVSEQLKERLAFPFAKTKQGFESIITKGEKERSWPKEIVRAFCESEPYIGGKGEHLFWLHRLDITDKHHLVIPAATILDLERIDLHAIDRSHHPATKIEGVGMFGYVSRMDIEGRGVVIWRITAESPTLIRANRN